MRDDEKADPDPIGTILKTNDISDIFDIHSSRHALMLDLNNFERWADGLFWGRSPAMERAVKKFRTSIADMREELRSDERRLRERIATAMGTKL